jgi:hypothetical protein
MKVVLAHGFLGLFDYFPVFFLVAGIWVIFKVLREGQGRVSHTSKLPTTPWSRQVATATRKRSAVAKPAGTPPDRPGQPRRSGPSHLRVMEGEAADGGPAVPRRFEPPPPGRRKTG